MPSPHPGLSTHGVKKISALRFTLELCKSRVLKSGRVPKSQSSGVPWLPLIQLQKVEDRCFPQSLGIWWCTWILSHHSRDPPHHIFRGSKPPSQVPSPNGKGMTEWKLAESQAAPGDLGKLWWKKISVLLTQAHEQSLLRLILETQISDLRPSPPPVTPLRAKPRGGRGAMLVGSSFQSRVGAGQPPAPETGREGGKAGSGERVRAGLATNLRR